MGRLRRIAAGGAFAALLLLLLEGASYLLGPVAVAPDPLVTATREDWTPLRRYDPLLFWSLRPHASHGQVQTNALGLRDREVGPRTGEEFRVLSLGESTTFAQGVAVEEGYSARLENGIGTIHGRRLRVVNAGVAGYSLFQGVAWLEHRGLELEPDAVMLYFGYNDFLPVAHRMQRDAMATVETGGLDDATLFAARRRWAPRWDAQLKRWSNLYRLLGRLTAPPPLEAEDARTVAQAGPSPRVPHEERRRQLARALELCRERGIHLTLIIPWYREFEDHIPLLREFAAEHDVTVVDLPRDLAAVGHRRASLFQDKVHPTAEGHARIARAIRRVVEPEWERVAR